jgi:hypothetical protein
LRIALAEVPTSEEETMPQDLDVAPEADRPAAALPDYDRLTVNEILARLPSIPRDELPALIDRETRGKHRKTLLQAFEDLLDGPPIPLYHRLSSREVVRRLRSMKREDVRKLRRHEYQHKARRTVLDAIERRLAAD